MKKLFYFVAIAVALVIAATSCSTPEEPNYEPAVASMAIEYSEPALPFSLR